uniref:Inositol polyphosphate-related phosphatase domain-containing protein n=1 Tax=Alexandrium monilatum TaxID=311494 RepID=A0A7S4V6A4_9DINO
MGCCCSCQSSTTAGSQLPLPQVTWDGGGVDGLCHGVEVGGIPLSYFLSQFSGLGPDERMEVSTAVVSDLRPSGLAAASAAQSDSHSQGCRLPGAPFRSTPSGGLCSRRPVRVGVFSWNVGGISDNRKEAGAGIHESSRGDVLKVLAAAVEELGAVELIIVGLQETISLTPQNAMKVMSSAGDSRRNQQFYSWPATVAQWVELLNRGLNARSGRNAPTSLSDAVRRQASDDVGSFALYGQPVYLFGMLLCVFCRTELLKHIKDFGMAEKAMDDHFNSGAKGVVACRFVLFDRSFCFINCHLSAQKRNGRKYNLKSFEKRVMQIQRIWTEVKFKSQVDQMVYPVSAHRAVFLLGDTNFRISAHHRWFLKGSKDFHATGRQACSDLWDHDQLFQELNRQRTEHGLEGRSSGRASFMSNASAGSRTSFQAGHMPTYTSYATHESGKSSGAAVDASVSKTDTALSEVGNKALLLWREPVPSGIVGPPFPPTFKLDVPGPGYSKKRVPAWTDRVLFRSQHAEPLVYGSIQQAEVLKPPRNISDHDPVFARFEVECVTVHSRKLAHLIREVRRPSGCSPASHPGQRHSFEQALAFQASVVEAAQPEIEDMARRLFLGFEEIGGNSDVANASASQFLEYQEECWHLLCEHFEAIVTDSLRLAASENRGTLDTAVTNRAVQEVLVRLRDNRRSRAVHCI